jgi:hypothetical protein
MHAIKKADEKSRTSLVGSINRTAHSFICAFDIHLYDVTLRRVMMSWLLSQTGVNQPQRIN